MSSNLHLAITIQGNQPQQQTAVSAALTHWLQTEACSHLHHYNHRRAATSHFQINHYEE